jgi:hypothetical protein
MLPPSTTAWPSGRRGVPIGELAKWRMVCSPRLQWSSGWTYPIVGPSPWSDCEMDHSSKCRLRVCRSQSPSLENSGIKPRTAKASNFQQDDEESGIPRYVPCPTRVARNPLANLSSGVAVRSILLAAISWKPCVSSQCLMSGWGQPFTFRPLNERQLLSAEADQALTFQKCHLKLFRVHGPAASR